LRERLKASVKHAAVLRSVGGIAIATTTTTTTAVAANAFGRICVSVWLCVCLSVCLCLSVCPVDAQTCESLDLET